MLNAVPLAADGAPLLGSLGKVYPVASVNGIFFDQDRVTVTEGRMADPARADEFVMTAEAAQLFGVHVGQVIPYGLYTNLQQQLSGFGTPSVVPKIRVEAKLVGLVAFNSQIVQDDIDRFPTFSVFTPALAREALTEREGFFLSRRHLQHPGGQRAETSPRWNASWLTWFRRVHSSPCMPPHPWRRKRIGR